MIQRDFLKEISHIGLQENQTKAVDTVVSPPLLIDSPAQL